MKEAKQIEVLSYSFGFTPLPAGESGITFDLVLDADPGDSLEGVNIQIVGAETPAHIYTLFGLPMQSVNLPNEIESGPYTAPPPIAASKTFDALLAESEFVFAQIKLDLTDGEESVSGRYFCDENNDGVIDESEAASGKTFSQDIEINDDGTVGDTGLDLPNYIASLLVPVVDDTGF